MFRPTLAVKREKKEKTSQRNRGQSSSRQQETQESAEIYPGTATEPVGGTGSKATGLEASRSRGMCTCDTMDKIVREGRPNSAILQQVCLSMPEHDKLVQLDGEMFFPLRNYNFLNLSFYLRTI